MILKLLILVFSIFLTICSGACYIYPLYLKHLNTQFGFTIVQTDLYGSFVNFGFWFAVSTGFVYDKLGPKLSSLIGASVLGGMFLVLHFILNSTLTYINFYLMLFIGFIKGQGAALLYITGVTTNVINFQIKEVSSIIGLLVANEAISPSIFTTYRDEQFGQSTIADYFVFVAVFIFIISIICAIFFKRQANSYSENLTLKAYERYKEKKIIKIFIYLAFGIIGFYIIGVVINNLSEESKYPNVIVYPCLQALNFIIVILEIKKVFDKVYVKDFIEENFEILSESQKTLLLEYDNHEVININEIITEKNNQENQDNNSNNELSKHSDGFNSDRINENRIEGHVENSFNNVPNKEIRENENSKSHQEHYNNFKDENPEDNKDNINKSDKVKSEVEIKDSNGIKIKINKEYEDNEDNQNENQNEIAKKDIALVEVNLQKPDIKGERAAIQPPNALNNEHELVIKNQNIAPDGSQNANHNSVSFKDSLSSLELWLCFIILCLNIGSCISNLNNIDYILKSLPDLIYDDKQIFQFVILYFLFNAISRLIGGLLLCEIKNSQIYHFLFAINCVCFTSQILGILMKHYALLVSLSLAGFSHGLLMTFIPFVVKHRYGVANYGKILGVLTTANAIGSICIGFLFTLFFNKYKLEENKPYCFGRECFYPAYIMTSVLTFCSVIIAYMLLNIIKAK